MFVLPDLNNDKQHVIILLVVGKQTGFNKKCSQWKENMYGCIVLIIRFKYALFIW